MTGKDSPTRDQRFSLIFTTALPLILIIGVIISQWVSDSSEAFPEYSVVFAVNGKYVSTCKKWYEKSLKRSHGKIVLEYVKKDRSGCHGSPDIYLYSPKKHSVDKIAYKSATDKSALETEKSRIIYDVPELDSFNLKEESPDGYTFEVGDYRDRPTFFFIRPSQRSIPVALRKGMRRVPIPKIDELTDYWRSKVVFLGWVIDGKDQP